ncbi:MAG TPA: FG-GAP-like repeat-containing protein [Pyrinomonadaceae bacterium]
MTTAIKAAGEIDPGFYAGAYFQPRRNIQTVVRQPDGKILIGGDFDVVGGYFRGGVARLHPDGSVDTSFNPPYLLTGETPKSVNAIGVQSDGKIIVAGALSRIGGVFLHAPIVRLNADGSWDTSFVVTSSSGSFGGSISVVDIRPDDKILIGGSFTLYGPIRRENLMRLNPNGTPDNTFLPGTPSAAVEDITVQPNGRILSYNKPGGSAGMYLERLLPDGTQDPSFSAFVSSQLNAVKVQTDGKILIGGTFTLANNIPRNRLARLHTDGLLDETFVIGIDAPITISDIEFGSDGKILIAGTFDHPGGLQSNLLARLNDDGSLDSSFNLNTEVTGMTYNKVADITPLPNGQILIGGIARRTHGSTGASVNRINSDGSADNSFKSYIGGRTEVTDIAPLPNGQTLITGYFSTVNETYRPGIARLNPDGGVDTVFNPTIAGNGYDPPIMTLAVQPDNKILIGGGFIGLLARLNPDGTTDATFNANLSSGWIYDLAILPDGKIITVGLATPQGGSTLYVAKFNQDGSVDNSFQFPGFTGNRIVKISVQSDGKILICGIFSRIGGIVRNNFARLNADGSLDTSFDPMGAANNTVLAVAQQADGKILIGGAFTRINGQFRASPARLNPNGSTDTTFNPMSISASAIKVQPADGKILFGSTSGIVRLNPNGSLDLSFNIGTGTNDGIFDTNDDIHAIELDAGGKVLAGGGFVTYNNTPRAGLVRLLNKIAPWGIPFDYDGIDGKADISVFRPSTGFWYITRPPFPQRDFDAVQFGVAGDVIVPADYDGDRKTDIAVWRPSDGVWYLMQSTAGFRAAQFGASGDIPVPGDYDGDGKANLAVFRPSAGAWYIARATGVPAHNFDSVRFGAIGDKPIVGADFDGDGKADVAVFRPLTGDWYRINSSTGQFIGVQFGISEDKPVAADYDGDGKTDLAVWRPSDGIWYRINSGMNTLAATQFGSSQDKPSPADYDGDGRADLAVFRPSEGVWYLLRSTQGFSTAQFGSNEDVPTPGSFVR